MSDTPVRKALLNGVHGILHIAFIPAVAILKGAIALLTYTHDELVKLGTPTPVAITPASTEPTTAAK